MMTEPTLYILKKRDSMTAAQQAAEKAYEAFLKEFPELTIRTQCVEIRELYALEGKVAYLIRVKVTADEQVYASIRHWATEQDACDVPVDYFAVEDLRRA